MHGPYVHAGVAIIIYHVLLSCWQWYSGLFIAATTSKEVVVCYMHRLAVPLRLNSFMHPSTSFWLYAG